MEEKRDETIELNIGALFFQILPLYKNPESKSFPHLK